MVDGKPVTTPMELDFKKLSGSVAGPILRNTTKYRQHVRALMFLVNSRLDICFAIDTLSQHMVEPHHINWIGAKNLLRYLGGTITYGLRYIIRDVRLLGYTDADWACSVMDRKSTFGCCFTFRSSSISWMSRKKKLVALRSTEAEYIAASMASCEAIWLQKIFNELFGFTLDTAVVLCDNQSGIRLSKNRVFHDHSKHINIKTIRSPVDRMIHPPMDKMIRSLADKMIRPLVDKMIRSLLGQDDLLSYAKDDSLSCGEDDSPSYGQDDSLSCGKG
eukprot:PITA_17634